MPVARGKVRSEAQRRAQNKYEAKTYKTLGCKLPIEVAQKFIEKVESDPEFFVAGKDKGSVNAALVSFIKEYLDK